MIINLEACRRDEQGGPPEEAD